MKKQRIYYLGFKTGLAVHTMSMPFNNKKEARTYIRNAYNAKPIYINFLGWYDESTILN